MTYLDTVEECDSEISRRHKLTYRSYADYEREIRGASGLDQLVILHGKPTTQDGAAIRVGGVVYWVDSGDEYTIISAVVENFDWIFDHWMVKLEKKGRLYGGTDLYSTRLAARPSDLALPIRDSRNRGQNQGTSTCSYLKYVEPQIRSLVIAPDNITLVQGFWLIYRKECSSPLHPKDIYRDRRRLVTICRKYWREKVKEVRAKLKVWNDDVKIRKLRNVIQANQT